jgi:hypothetical protein
MHTDPAHGGDPRSALLRSLETWGGADEGAAGPLLAALERRLQHGGSGSAGADMLAVQQLLVRLPLLNRVKLQAVLAPVWAGGSPPAFGPPAPAAPAPRVSPPSETRRRLERLARTAASRVDAPPPLARFAARAQEAASDATLSDSVLQVWVEGLARLLALEEDVAAPWRRSEQALALAGAAVSRRPEGEGPEGAKLRARLEDPSASLADLLEVRARLALLGGGSMAESPPHGEGGEP